MTLKIHTRVSWYDGGGFSRSERRGIVTRATASTVWVQPDQGSDLKQFRKGKYGFEPKPLSDYELKLEMWLAAKPKTQAIGVTFGLGSATYVDRARTQLQSVVERNTATPDVLDRIAREATALAEWLRSRPEPE